MKNDLYPQFPTLNQRQIGEHFGVSSHVVGRWLKEVGLREPNGEPTPSAVEAGFAEPVDLGDGTHPFWVWQKKTVDYLEQHGHPRLPLVGSDPLPVDHLVGPFTVKSHGADGHQIMDANGITGVWVRGEENATLVKNLMNLANEYRGWWK
jgi:hypothetical protein